MYIRQRIIGDMYLACSLIFIYLSLLYFGMAVYRYGLIFIIIGLALAVFGGITKQYLKRKEKSKIILKAGKKKKK